MWRFETTHDQSLSPAEFQKLDADTQASLLRVAYLSPTSNIWIYPPENDPARFTNHSESNNLSVVLDTAVSTEPFFRANRDIEAGEELTVNYLEFDARPKDKVLDWK